MSLHSLAPKNKYVYHSTTFLYHIHRSFFPHKSSIAMTYSTYSHNCTRIRTLHILYSSAAVLEIPRVHLFLHQGFPIKLLSQSSQLPFWQLPAYICLNLSPLSRVQQVNEHSHFPTLTSICRWGGASPLKGKVRK